MVTLAREGEDDERMEEVILVEQSNQFKNVEGIDSQRFLGNYVLRKMCDEVFISCKQHNEKIWRVKNYNRIVITK